MEEYIRLVKRLSLINVLSTSVTESTIASGSIWSDTRTTLWSKMVEGVLKRYAPLRLHRFLGQNKEDLFLSWLKHQLLEYANKDMYCITSFVQAAQKDKGLYWYEIEPQSERTSYLYYNLSQSRLTYILQRLEFNTVYFPCTYSLYIEKDISDLIHDSYKREQKNEQQKKNSSNRFR